jgi:hypothetical protein
MVIDASGNLGLGVTPSAWGTGGWKALDIGSRASFVSSNSSDAIVGYNAYNNGTNWIYKATAAASVYLQGSGSHQWFTAPSGTAGNAISFTQAMTLDASGNLGVGTTSPAYKLHINSGTVNTVAVFESSDATAIIGFKDNSTTNIPSIGAVADVMIFNTGAAERARIDSDGNFLIGTATQEGRLTVNCPSASQNGANIICSNTSGPNYVLNLQSNASVANTINLIRGYSNTSTGVFFVAGNGDVTNTNNSYGAISDAKLKENVVEATPKLDKLNQVRIVNFNMIGDEQKQIGVIAQELEQVFPGMVNESPDRDKDGNDLGTTTKSVKYSVFVPMLIKAIQEQQAIINSLKARLDAANL